jgi:RNA-binding protein YlmH
MTPPRVPVPDPVTFDFGNGTKLTTFINPQTQKHSVNCDLCGFTVHLGVSASGGNLHSHRNSDVCKRTAFKLEKEQAQGRLKVCLAISIL